MNKRLCIIYGLNEGPAMGRKLVLACEQAGFTLVADPRRADILFAHSGGCFLIPPDNQAERVVLVGLPYWPGRPWILATARKVWREARTYRQQHQLREWSYKWRYHLRYSLNVRAAWQMAVHQGLSNPWNGPQPQIIIRNRYDEYCSPAIAQAAFNGPRTFVSLPGEHDDCWGHPEAYVSLLQSE